jgi:rhodanese-related sulfurtransferase
VSAAGDPGGTTAEGLLREARSALRRLSPADARAAMGEGALLIDIRSDSQRTATGAYRARGSSRATSSNGASIRPASTAIRTSPVDDRRVIVICDEDYQSSLAAATLTRFGLDATDVIGGFQAWRSAGLPVEPAEPT